MVYVVVLNLQIIIADFFRARFVAADNGAAATTGGDKKHNCPFAYTSSNDDKKYRCRTSLFAILLHPFKITTARFH